MPVDVNQAMLVRLQRACRVTQNNGMKDVEAVHEFALKEGKPRGCPANDLRSDTPGPGFVKRREHRPSLTDAAQVVQRRESWSASCRTALDISPLRQ
jgi:hypothetical protein